MVSDDHDVVCQGLRVYLRLDPALEVVEEAINSQEALRMARWFRPDVVLMDLLVLVIQW